MSAGGLTRVVMRGSNNFLDGSLAANKTFSHSFEWQQLSFCLVLSYSVKARSKKRGCISHRGVLPSKAT